MNEDWDWMQDISAMIFTILIFACLLGAAIGAYYWVTA